MSQGGDGWRSRIGRFTAADQLGFWHTWLIGCRITMSVLLGLGFAMFCGAFIASFLYMVVAVLPAELVFGTTKLEDYWTQSALFGCVVWGVYFVGQMREKLTEIIALAGRIGT